MLTLLKPVVYSDERPLLIANAQEWIDTWGKPGSENARKVMDRLLHTKSSEWNYEQEWRLAIPNALKNGEEAAFYRFYPHEAVEVYFGCRMDDKTKSAIIGWRRR